MPASPEFRDGRRLVRRIKVHIKPETQQQCDPDRHIRIAGEIAIDLQGITIHTQQIFHPRIEQRGIEYAVDEIQTDIVGYNRFLEESTQDEESPSPNSTRVTTGIL